jgi:hypothetical protein
MSPQERQLFDLYNAETNERIGGITEADLDYLIDHIIEEESSDYIVDQEVIHLFALGRGSEHLVGLLRKALGSREWVVIRWEPQGPEADVSG